MRTQISFRLGVGVTALMVLAGLGLTGCDAEDQEMQPFVSAPATTSAPSTTAPSATAPSTTAPVTTAPPTTAPETSQAPATTTAVATTAPETTVPVADAAPATTVAEPAQAPTQAPEPAAVERFPNCDALVAVYPHGVARTGGFDNKGKTGFVVDDAVYARNSHLDRDNDGVACER